MKRLITLVLAVMITVPAAMAYAANSEAEQRTAIHQMEADTLTKLYQQRPQAQQEIQNAVGYAVFTNGSLALIWVSGGYGHGIAHDNRNGDSTFMQMASAGVGLGLGVKDYNTVFIFNDAKAFEDFKNTGLDLTANADAAAKLKTKGDAASGAADVLPGVRIYQLTDSGLMAQAMLQGTKYWRDDSLNK